jgi:hypothetical protein
MTSRSSLTMAGAIAATAVLAACSGTPAPGASSASPSPAAPATSQPAAATESSPSGDIPDNQAYVAFSPAGGGYSVKIPEGWSRTAAGTSTSFTDKLNHIEVSMAPAPTQPTIASVTSNEVPALQTKVPNFAMGKVTSVVRRGGSAILLTYQGDSAPDQVTGKVIRDAFERYTFYRAGGRVDLTLSGPTNADNVDPWRIVSDSLRWS